MRILGFSKRWQKLSNSEFTTFRFPRRDRDWQVGEQVQIVYKPRSKERRKLGIAIIISRDIRKIGTAFEQYRPTEDEAQSDGFASLIEMNKWFSETYGRRVFSEPMNKLTLRWLK